jgi:hypothetical protein
MNTMVVLDRFTLFKRDSARRIDRVIDYFGEPLRSRARRDERHDAVIEIRWFQSARFSRGGGPRAAFR